MKLCKKCGQDEKFMADNETKQRAAHEQLARMLPDVLALIKTVTQKEPV